MPDDSKPQTRKDTRRNRALTPLRGHCSKINAGPARAAPLFAIFLYSTYSTRLVLLKCQQFVDREVVKRLSLAARPADLHRIDPRSVSQSEVHSRVA